MADRSPKLSLAEQVDALCDRYEHEYRAGKQPRIESMLPEADPAIRTACLKGLLELELELLRKAGELPRLADYKIRFPKDCELVQLIFNDHSRAASQASSVRITGIESSQNPETRLAPTKVVKAVAPKTLGRFEIRSVLGEGAFGTVYRARDPQLDRNVALKVPKFVGQQSSDDRERFLREARAAAGLHHAHICPVHEVGTIDGVDYIVLSYIDGKPLSKMLQSKPTLSNRQITAVIRKLAMALQEAHDKGIIHRDLKPANIMISRKGEPVIMDFGLARRSHSADAQISHSGQIMGTPAYMSPEQARGDGKAVGPASDIYSLGIVLYELICGRRPFEGTVTEVLGQILHVEAPLPARFRPNVDVRLQDICLKAISKKPTDRFSSMKEFAAALTEFARTAPSEARPSAPVVESGNDIVTDQFAGLLAAISSDVESKVERAVRAAGRNHRIPWWTYLVGSSVMGLMILWGILFLIKKDTVTVIVSIPIENINDPSLSFILDKEPIAAEKFASPIELKPGEHELIVNKDGSLFKRFVFSVGKEDNDPVVVQDVTPKAEPADLSSVVENDLQRWQGTWQCVGGNIDGKVVTEEHARRDGHIQIVNENSVTRVYGARLPSAFKIDPTKSPKHYDSDLATMAHPGGPFRHSGVYEFEGDRLRLIFRYRPIEKPIERATWEDRGKSGTVYLEYVRDLAKEGFVTIFNGNDLKGWTAEGNDTENWKVQDGAITAIAEDAQPARGAETWLLSDKEYQDFILRFEFRTVSETVNSGFGYRAVPKEIPPVGNESYSAPSHLQVELFDSDANGTNQTLKTGTILGSLGPQLVIPANPGNVQKGRREWNRVEIAAVGQSVRIQLNGIEIVKDSLDSLLAKGATYPGLQRPSGRIAFQRLRGTIQFRDIQIKELAPSQPSTSVLQAGWNDLFNGKDLTGWDGTEGHWRVEDGVIVGQPVGTKNFSYLMSKSSFSDFELQVQFRLLNQGNGGVQYRSRVDENGRANGHAADIGFSTMRESLGLNITGDLMHQGNPPPGSPNFLSTAKGEKRAEINSIYRPAEWNDLTIRCVGDRETVALNGLVTASVSGSKGEKSGQIGLQAGPDTIIEFRAIRVRRIGARGVPANAKSHRGHSYVFFPEQLSWTEARARCEELGGHLVIIEDLEENVFVADLITDGGKLDSWIGATDEVSEGQWHWVDGRNMTWTNWFKRQNQPNNKGGVEHFGLMSNRKLVDGFIGWEWSDQPNESQTQHQPGYACEWDAMPALVP